MDGDLFSLHDFYATHRGDSHHRRQKTGREGSRPLADSPSASFSNSLTSAQPPRYPISYFLYGKLADPATLQTVFCFDEEPKTRPARLLGYIKVNCDTECVVTLAKAGCHECVPKRFVEGKVYKVRNEYEEGRLKERISGRFGERDNCKSQAVDIQIFKTLRSPKRIVGRCFVSANDPELEEQCMIDARSTASNYSNSHLEPLSGSFSALHSSAGDNSRVVLPVPCEGPDQAAALKNDRARQGTISTQSSTMSRIKRRRRMSLLLRSIKKADNADDYSEKDQVVAMTGRHITVTVESLRVSDPSGDPLRRLSSSRLTWSRPLTDLDAIEREDAPLPNSISKTTWLLHTARSQRQSWDQKLKYRSEAPIRTQETPNSSAEVKDEEAAHAPALADLKSYNQILLEGTGAYVYHGPPHQTARARQVRSTSPTSRAPPPPSLCEARLAQTGSPTLYTFFNDSSSSIVTDMATLASSEAPELRILDLDDASDDNETSLMTTTEAEAAREAGHGGAVCASIAPRTPPRAGIARADIRARTPSEGIRQRVDMYEGLSPPRSSAREASGAA